MPKSRSKAIKGNQETWKKRFCKSPTAELEEILLILPDSPERRGVELVLRDRLDVETLIAFKEDTIRRLRYIDGWLRKQPARSLDYIAANTRSANLRGLIALIAATTGDTKESGTRPSKLIESQKKSVLKKRNSPKTAKKPQPSKTQRVKSKKSVSPQSNPSNMPVGSVLTLNATAASERPYQDPTMPYSQKWDMPEWDGS